MDYTTLDDCPTLDEIVQRLVDATEAEREARWHMAGLFCLAVEKRGVTPKEIGSRTNCSAAHVRELVKTFKAFPEETMRVPEMPFTIHRMCAGTDDPTGWLDKAVEGQWSSRQLREAINGETVDDPLKKIEALVKKIEKVLLEGGEPATVLRERLRGMVCDG